MTDRFITMLSLLTAQIKEQDQTITEKTRRSLAFTISLTICVATTFPMPTSWSASFYNCEDRIRELTRELNDTRTKLCKAETILGVNNLPDKDKAEAYMVAEGDARWAKGEKIAVIKCVREATQWGLKETKDYCEARQRAEVDGRWAFVDGVEVDRWLDGRQA